MTMSMVIPLLLASMLFGGCGNETKRTAAEAVPRTDQRGTVPNPDRHKKPPSQMLRPSFGSIPQMVFSTSFNVQQPAAPMSKVPVAMIVELIAASYRVDASRKE